MPGHGVFKGQAGTPATVHMVVMSLMAFKRSSSWRNKAWRSATPPLMRQDFERASASRKPGGKALVPGHRRKSARGATRGLGVWCAAAVAECVPRSGTAWMGRGVCTGEFLRDDNMLGFLVKARSSGRPCVPEPALWVAAVASASQQLQDWGAGGFGRPALEGGSGGPTIWP
jgi:hypothetical protein